MYPTNLKCRMATVCTLSIAHMLFSPMAIAQVIPSLGAAVSGSFQAHLHIGGDPNSSGAQSTSDIIFSNLDKYGTLDFDAGATTVLSEPSLLIVDTTDGDRLYGVSYAPIESAVKAKISNFVIESGDLKIKDSSSPAKEHKVSLAALSSALDIKSIYTANDKLTADRSVNLDGKVLTFNGANRDFAIGGTSFKITDLSDKTGKTNTTLTSTDLQLNVGDKKGARLSRSKDANAAFTVTNTGTGGVAFDVDGNGDADAVFTVAKFGLKSQDGKGVFLFNRSDTVNGGVAFRNLGTGSFTFNPSDGPKPRFEIASSGSIKLPYYGEATSKFPGNAKNDRVLTVDGNGTVREVPASALDTSLAVNNQTLTADRSVNLDGKVLTFNGANRDFAIGGTSFKITDLSDKTGKTNTTLTSTDLQLNVGDKKGARLSRSKDANAAFTVTNTGTGGVAFDVDGNGEADAVISVAKFGLKSQDGKGVFIFNRSDSVNGSVAFRNIGTGSFTFNPGDSGKHRFEIASSGSIKLPYYGEATSKFPGNAKNDRVLTVDGNGTVREVPASALDTSLEVNNQTLTDNRSVNLAGKVLTFNGAITDFDFDGTKDELSIFRTVNDHKVTISPGSVKFSASQATASGGQETSGLSHGGAVGETLRIYNSGSGGIGLDSNNDNTNDVVLGSDGSLDLKQYGKNTFKGDASKDYVLSVDVNGNLRELTLDSLAQSISAQSIPQDLAAAVAKNLPEKSIPASALPDSAFADKRLSTDNQTLTDNRSVNLDGKVLTFNGANRDFAIGGTSFKITDLSDKTGKTNTTLTSTDLQLNVGDKKGTRLSRSKDANAAFTVTNTGTGGVAFDVDGNGAADAIITVSKFGLKSQDGKGIFLFNRGNTVHGNVAFRNLGMGSFTFNPSDSGKPRFEIASSGLIKLPYYGQATSKFPGDASKDYVLSVDANGNVGELSVKSLGLGSHNQNLSSDRTIEIGSNTLTLSGKTVIGVPAPTVAANAKTVATNTTNTTAGDNVLVVNGKSKFDGETTVKTMVLGTDTTNVALNASGAVIIDSSGSNSQYGLEVSGNTAYFRDGALSTSFRAVSDRRLKQDIQPFNSGMDIVRQIKTYNYRFKLDDEQIKHYGVIAQEIEAIDPNLVSRFVNTDDNVEYLSVHTNSLTYIMLDALKNLDAELAETKAAMEEELAKRDAKYDAMMAEMLSRLEALSD